MAVDFDRIAAAALAQAERLCHEWLGGKRQGHEWLGERRVNGGPGDSWSVNLTTGAWLHGAGDERGGDIISLYAALNHCEQAAAARAVGELCNVPANGHAGPAHIPAAMPEQSCQPIPDGDPPLHPKHGAPEALYRYARAFVIGRYQTAEGKTFAQWTYRAGRWTLKAHPALRPIFGLEELAAKPQAPVLIVEGEKCALAARAALAAYACVTWAGGAQAVKTADWSVLHGKAVIIWPDADEPGINAARTLAEILLPICAQVRVIRPDGQPLGWDIADAIAERWTSSEIVAWAKDHIQEIPRPKIGRLHDNRAPVAQIDPPGSAVVSWHLLGLECNSGGMPEPTLSNASLIIQEHPLWRGHVWFDRFRGLIYTDFFGRSQQWTDHDDLKLAAWMQKSLRLPKFTLGLVKESVTHAALANERNSVTDWLSSLEWDGESRIQTWLSDCLGVPLNAYSQAVARNWLLSMVARAYRPGVQVDHMPILEGKMGRGKSTFLRILGGEWYSALPDAFGSKDFLQGIVGQWLIEVPDLAGFNRREHQHILAIITTPVDRYRASYGRHTEDHPRTCIFTATSETDEYLQDARGRRRFWPLRCESIDLDAISGMRSQLFAEAVSVFKSGASWHEIPEDDADAQQLERVEEDTWSERILAYVERRSIDSFGQIIEPALTSTGILSAIGVDLPDQHDGLKRRIKTVMTSHGWTQKIVKEQGRSVKKWGKGSVW